MLGKLLILSILIMWGSHSLAADSQLHIRTGILQGKYWGAQSGEFLVPNTFDAEYEVFLANSRSFLFRSMLAMELTTAKPYYSYSGIGMRYYLASKGMMFDAQDEGVSIISIPKWRYYVGWDFGISTAIVQSLGKVLQIMSTMIDFGGHAGVIYQVDSTFGIEGHVGATTGQGFSSVSVVGVTLRAFVGGTYQF